DVVDMGYIAGAATDRNMRHHGYMSELLKLALRKAYERGDVLVSLIPASRRLFFFYDKLDFATVFYVDIERYTSLHTFAFSEGYSETEPKYEDFQRLEQERSATVLHSERDFQNVLEDIRHDRGAVSAIASPDGQVSAMAFATETDNEIHVKELLFKDDKAAEMALGSIKQELGDKPMVVYGPPSGRKAMMRARGMMRIVNAEKALDSLARQHPEIDQVIRVRDPHMSVNTGYYILKKGSCRKVETYGKQVSLDVSISNLTKILFSSHKIGEIFNLPTSHALLPLMLD
ncbi:MAG: GNAT family N-acetyltransferase, partial [Muribaculaceae bacterium]|nr:GNAT family N-acetyltransferase [Muribaculaceae bacterium]